MNTPEKKFIAGPIAATVWQNQGKNRTGEVVGYRTVSLQRSYKDKNGVWQHTSSFRANDLPRATLVLQKAFEFLTLREAQSDNSYVAEEEVIEEVI